MIKTVVDYLDSPQSDWLFIILLLAGLIIAWRELLKGFTNNNSKDGGKDYGKDSK
jgi:hypothetical protein